jgi:hypothetical protein
VARRDGVRDVSDGSGGAPLVARLPQQGQLGRPRDAKKKSGKRKEGVLRSLGASFKS